MHIESWFWAIVFLAAFILFAFLKFDPSITPTDEFIEFNSARLDEFASKPMQYKVVLLGDSRLKYATLRDEELERLAENRNADIAFLRIVHNQAQFADFEPILDLIFAARPTLIVLQDSLLTRDRDDDVDLRTLQKLIVWALVDGDGTWNPHGINQADLQFGTHCLGSATAGMRDNMSDETMLAFVREVRDRGTRDPNGPNARTARNFITSARHQGSQVVTLRLPSTDAYREIIASAFPIYSLAAEMTGSDPAVWEYPGQLDTDDFCDLMHLDRDGRTKVSHWLTARAISASQPGPELSRLVRLQSTTRN